ncbi:MAG: hypothetical protein IPK80_36215 [Nannocystis sp.]|nr:hypothetical protein [Nannocystis sp.]
MDAIYPVEKDLTRGLLALSGQGAFFLADRFGRWQLDREYLRTEGIRAKSAAASPRSSYVSRRASSMT